MTFTYCKKTYKIVAIDFVQGRKIRNVMKFPKRVSKPWIIFRLFISNMEFEEGFYYKNDKYNKYFIGENEIEIDGECYEKPKIIIRLHKLEGQGGFERTFYLNDNEEAKKFYDYYANFMETKVLSPM